MKEYIERIGCFTCVLDPYNGITVEPNSMPNNKEEFQSQIKNLIDTCLKDERRLIWITIDIEKSEFIPIAASLGFEFHTCEKDYIFMVKRLVQDAVIPTAVNHTLGVGIVVINEKNELLVVLEKVSKAGYKLPGGHIDNGELISEAVVRETYEETGIEVEFESILSLGHFYPHQFHQSNLYVLCLAKPLTDEIEVQDKDEILDAKWIDVYEYLQDENVIEYNKIIVSTALNLKGFELHDIESFKNIPKSYELFFPGKS